MGKEILCGTLLRGLGADHWVRDDFCLSAMAWHVGNLSPSHDVSGLVLLSAGANHADLATETGRIASQTRVGSDRHGFIAGAIGGLFFRF